jgi:energy-coupling factor transporter ATP-binding protein EcfA2
MAGAGRRYKSGDAVFEEPTPLYRTPPQLTKDMGPHEAALTYAAHGWKVFPVDHPSLPQCAGIGKDHDPRHIEDRGKCPCVKFSTAATCNPKMIDMWWSSGPRNVGVYMGGSNLLVVDEDKPNALAKYAADHGVTIPDTFTVTTGKGKHYYFQDLDMGALGNQEGALRDYGINIRSGNAYVVGHGSQHAETGAIYIADPNHGPAPRPRWLADAIKNKGNGHQKTTTADGFRWEDVGGFDPFELPEVIKEHYRDSTLFKFACSMRAQGLNYNHAKVLMKTAWKSCEQPPKAKTRFTLEEAITKLDNAYDNYEDGRSDGYQKTANGKEQQQDSERRLKATKASDIAMTATRWLWEAGEHCWIPLGELVGLGGREGVGKSTMCAHLAAQVTKGELPGDFYGTPKSVIIVSTEDDWSATIKPRLVAAGADLDRVFQVKSVEPDGLEGTLSLPEDMKRLEDLIKEHDVALIILDPLLTMVNAKLDTHKDAEVRRALEPVVTVAHAAKASLVGLVHVNKSNEGDLLNRIMASRALTGVPRGFLFCANHTPIETLHDMDGEEHLFAEPRAGRQEFLFGQIKNNLAAKVMISHRYHMETVTVGHDEDAQKDIKTSKVVIHGLIAQNVEDIVLEQEKARKGIRTQSTKATAWLVGYLSGKDEVPSAQIKKDGKAAADLSPDSINRARQKLGPERIEVRTSGMPATTTWKLLKENLQ